MDRIYYFDKECSFVKVGFFNNLLCTRLLKIDDEYIENLKGVNYIEEVTKCGDEFITEKKEIIFEIKGEFYIAHNEKRMNEMKEVYNG